MIYTESEAQNKRCPLMLSHPNALDTCVVSECMAWRWATKDKGYCGLGGAPVTKGVPDVEYCDVGTHWPVHYQTRPPADHYCCDHLIGLYTDALGTSLVSMESDITPNYYFGACPKCGEPLRERETDHA